MLKKLTFTTMAVSMFALFGCGSDSSSGSSGAPCETPELPQSSLEFSTNGASCVAKQDMQPEEYTQLTMDLITNGFNPEMAQQNGTATTQDYSKSTKEAKILLTLTYDISTTKMEATYTKTMKEVGANASECDKATAGLPASELAWKPTFSGECEVAQQFDLESLQAYDEELDLYGYTKDELTKESYRYTRVNIDPTGYVETANRDTLAFTYSMGTFLGTFNSTPSPLSNLGRIVYNYMSTVVDDMEKENLAFKTSYKNSAKIKTLPKKNDEFISTMQAAGFTLKRRNQSACPGCGDYYMYDAIINDGDYGEITLYLEWQEESVKEPSGFKTMEVKKIGGVDISGLF